MHADDSETEIWQTPETWLEVDADLVLWAWYPFKNRQSCAKKYVEKNDPLGGKKWNIYKVSTLYFPEVHTTNYEKAERLCQEIGERPLTDEGARPNSLRNAVLAFHVRHVIGEHNTSQVNICMLRWKFL